ncbi:unnamed protein product [Blepharisma stoltei]|uniref:Uncharacterized protein n=1 Tax=Blepharisma stoltei TaxID=1481888 RepID=A0AAU9JNV9_9CILI|nr:unnamed protein product [Blepharisma stoltei]
MEHLIMQPKISKNTSNEAFGVDLNSKKSFEDAAKSLTDHVQKKKKVDTGLLSTADAISISKKLKHSLSRLEKMPPAYSQASTTDPSKFIVNEKHKFSSVRHRPSFSFGSSPPLPKPLTKRKSIKLHLQLSEIKKLNKTPVSENKKFELPISTFVTGSTCTFRPTSCDLYQTTANSPRKPKTTRNCSQVCLDTIINECQELVNSNRKETGRIIEEDKFIKSAFKRLNKCVEKPRENLNKEYIHEFVKDFKSDKIAFVYGRGNQGLYLRSSKKELIKLL